MSLCFPLAKKRTLDLSGRRVNWFNRVEARTSPQVFWCFFWYQEGCSWLTWLVTSVGDKQPMNVGCGASYGCTQRAESGAAMSHYMCDLIPRCVGFLAAMTGLHIHHIHHVHIWDCLVIFRSACWSICDTASCHGLLGFHHLPQFPEHSWARWSIFPYDWQQRSVVAALQIMNFLCFLYPLHGLRHHNSD